MSGYDRAQSSTPIDRVVADAPMVSPGKRARTQSLADGRPGAQPSPDRLEPSLAHEGGPAHLGGTAGADPARANEDFAFAVRPDLHARGDVYLRDFVDRKNADRALELAEIQTTLEYKSYMDPKMIWQWKYKASHDEAVSACIMMWAALRDGKRVDWEREALHYLMNARGSLVVTYNGPGGDAAAAVQHYEVELKAWIPHARVVDPEDVELLRPVMRESFYRGDDHQNYDGSYRVLAVVSFDWDGSRVTNFATKEDYGTTHRDVYERGRMVDTASDTAGSATWGKQTSETTFEMGMASGNPLIRIWAPDIDSRLTGRMGCDGLSLHYHTDGFPSHGIRVSVDGRIEMTEIVNDASFKEGLGAAGLQVVLIGLTGGDFSDGDLRVVPQTPNACQQVPGEYPDELPTTVGP